MTRRCAGVLLVLLLAACSGSGGDEDASTPDGDDTALAVRFCDAYLDYLADRSPANLQVVVEASASTPVADDVEALAAVLDDDDRTGRVLAADQDLEDLARRRCQSEWIAGAQGAGNTAAAAAAMIDALRAGDRFGARNIASANAIAVFEPWTPPDDPADIAIVEVLDGSFGMVLGPEALAECQVETGVVIACTVTE